MQTNDAQPLNIGELARRTGLTVRALHHYDELGLLRPSERTYAGHRLYAEEEVRRLYRIVALRSLGVPLVRIGELIEQRGDDPLEAVREHLAEVDRQIEAQQQLRARLVRIVDALERIDGPSATDYIDAIERMTMIEKHYTPEQLEYLAKRREELGEEKIHEVEAEWPRLIAAVEAEIERGTDPSDPKARELAARWRELVAMFHGGNEGVRDSLRTMWEETPRDEMVRRVEATAGEEAAAGIPGPEVSEFIARANEVAGESF
jgi:DNA-binding transcriptional MerR regulator